MFPKMETERLILRYWREDDLAGFAELNADPQVMEFFPWTLTMLETQALMSVMIERTASDGFSFAPVEEKQTGRFIGFVGLNRPRHDPALPFEPCVEIGWRLLPSAWGKGYATEAARAWLGFGFETLGLSEIVAMTTEHNTASRAVMERLGMRYDPRDDFDHPGVEQGHALQRHVLYRLRRDQAE